MARSPLTELRVLIALLAVACSPQPESWKGTDSGGGDSPGDTAPPLPPCNDDPFVTVEVGYAALCGTHADGCVECAALQADWVEDYGLATPPSRDLSSVSLSDGCRDPYDVLDCVPQYGVCALLAAGTPVCWGWPYGEMSGTDPLTVLKTGFRHACGLDVDGQASCLGTCENGACESASGAFTSIVSGHDFSCGLDAEGVVTCWGYDAGAFGQISDAWQNAMDEWKQGPFESLFAVPSEVCGVEDGGALACFDYNGGIDTRGFSLPGAASSWLAVPDINSFAEAACALTDLGQITCSSDLAQIPVHQLDPYRFSMIASSHDRLCGVTVDGEIVCAVIGDTWAYCPFCTELFPDE